MARNLISSDTSIKAIKPGDPRKRLNDGDGLHLLLFVKGGAHGWRLAYSLNGARNILSLGTYPDTGLALARRKADEARKLIREGTDPSDVRKSAKAEAERQRQAERLADAGLPPEGPRATQPAPASAWNRTCSPGLAASRSTASMPPSC
jgi:hypothetical protein